MTDIEKYDKMVSYYLSGISDKLIYSVTSNARKYIAHTQSTNDKVPWKFISFYRGSTFEFDISRDNYFLKRIGETVKREKDSDGKVITSRVSSFPINLTYNIDIWSSTHTGVLELAMDVVHRLIFEMPTFKDADKELSPTGEVARFNTQSIDWVDNSDIEQEENLGKYYRHTVTIILECTLVYPRISKPLPAFSLKDMPIDIYEGKDINNEVCKECDFDKLKVTG